jgi:CSLREA domain-containing protein
LTHYDALGVTGDTPREEVVATVWANRLAGMIVNHASAAEADSAAPGCFSEDLTHYDELVGEGSSALTSALGACHCWGRHVDCPVCDEAGTPRPVRLDRGLSGATCPRYRRRRTQTERRERRHLWQGLPILIATLALAAVLVLAPSAIAATFTVTSTTDAVDTNPGDGVCRTPLFQCSLRAAIQEADVHPGPDEVLVPNGTFTLTRISPDPANDDITGGDVDITGEELVISGSGATVINANHIDRVFENTASDPVTISGLAITGGLADVGGGVLNEGDAPLTLENVTISGNEATPAPPPPAEVSLGGGGVAALDATVFINATVADNHAPPGAGGGIGKFGDSQVVVFNTIVAGNPGDNCAFEPGTLPIESLGGNLDSHVTCRLADPSDLSNVRPLLTPLEGDGVHALRPDSPAINRGLNLSAEHPDLGRLRCPPTDQRGVARPIGPRCDIGAYERNTAGDPPPSCPDRSIHLPGADADSTVDQSDPEKNFGEDSSLKVRSAPGGNMRALVRFPLPAIPPGCAVIGSTLRLTAGGSVAGRTLEVLRLASNWTELGVRWINQPATDGDPALAPSGEPIVMWGVTDQLGDMYLLGNFGLLIRDAIENDNGEQVFDSRETPDPPVLSVVFGSPSAAPQGAPRGPRARRCRGRAHRHRPCRHAHPRPCRRCG